MADHLSKSERSKLMAGITGKDSKPELLVRRTLHRLGYRFRLHEPTLPGRPDIIIPKYRTIIFVNGCFWHGHSCARASLPKSNAEFWEKKIAGNIRRDARTQRRLRQAGWSVYVVWTCRFQEGTNRVLRHLEAKKAYLDSNSVYRATR